MLSLVKQTLREIEIIVVNDGSDDNTENILSAFRQYDTRIKIVNQTHQKQGVARNNGTQTATEEYIGFVDSDDWIDLDYYEKLYNTAKKYNSDIALGTNIRTGNGKNKKRLNITEEKIVYSLQDKIDMNKQWHNPCPTNKIYRREMLEKNNIKWPEGVYCEDKLFTIQAVYFANSIVSVPGVNYYYFKNPNSTVNTKTSKHFSQLIQDKNRAKMEVLKFLKEKNAQIRDRDFWATKYEFNILGVTIFRIEESLHTERVRCFGIPVITKSLNN